MQTGSRDERSFLNDIAQIAKTNARIAAALEELVLDTQVRKSQERSRQHRRAEAAEWLTKFLWQNGPTDQDEVIAAAAVAGFDEAELELARADMDVAPTPKWQLPQDVKELIG
jgi:hypothetical protein